MQGGSPVPIRRMGAGARRTVSVRRSAARASRVPSQRLGAADGPFSAAFQGALASDQIGIRLTLAHDMELVAAYHDLGSAGRAL